eukprot:6174154-Pleurochrysis_carterae.AAC.2
MRLGSEFCAAAAPPLNVGPVRLATYSSHRPVLACSLVIAVSLAVALLLFAAAAAAATAAADKDDDADAKASLDSLLWSAEGAVDVVFVGAAGAVSGAEAGADTTVQGKLRSARCNLERTTIRFLARKELADYK